MHRNPLQILTGFCAVTVVPAGKLANRFVSCLSAPAGPDPARYSLRRVSVGTTPAVRRAECLWPDARDCFSCGACREAGATGMMPSGSIAWSPCGPRTGCFMHSVCSIRRRPAGWVGGCAHGIETSPVRCCRGVFQACLCMSYRGRAGMSLCAGTYVFICVHA